MAVYSRVKMNKARHQQGEINKKNQEARDKRIEEEKNSQPVSEEEHKKRVELLKQLGLIKG